MKFESAISTSRHRPRIQLNSRGRWKAAGEKYAQQVQHGQDQQQVAAPVVQVADKLPHPDFRFHPVDAGIGRFRGGRVDEQQQYAGHHQHQEQQNRQPAQAEAVRQRQGAPGDFGRVQVKNQIVQNQSDAPPFILGEGFTPDRAPDTRTVTWIGGVTFLVPQSSG